MPNYYRFEQQFFDYLKNVERNIKASPIYLGLGSGAGASIIGDLPQTRVSYDSNELATNTTVSGPSLLDNLNHIRWDITVLEAMCGSGSGAGLGHIIYDDEIALTPREKLTILGAGVIITDDEANDSTDLLIESSFLNLTDTPSSYVTQSGKTVIVKGSEDGVEFSSIESGGVSGNKILRYDAGGDVAEEYDVDEAGLRSALSDATSGDLVLLPPQTITVADDGDSGGIGSLKINAGVTLKGLNQKFSKISATINSADVGTRVLIYAYDGAHLENLTIEYNRSNATPAICVFHNYGAVEDTGTTLKDVTIVAESTDDISGLVTQIRAYDDRDNVAIDNCSIYVSGSDAENVIETKNTTYWDQRIIIRDSSFVCIDSTERITNYPYGIYLLGGGLNRIVIDNCYVHTEITTASTNRSRVYGIKGFGNVEIKDTMVIARNVGTHIQTETIAIEMWADSYPNYPDDDKITDLILINNCVGQAISNSTSTSITYMTSGFTGSDVTMLDSFFSGECGGGDKVFGAYVYSDDYICELRNSTFQGTTYDLYATIYENISLYSCQYETLQEDVGTVTILQGDRGSYYPEKYHCLDIEDDDLTRHLPLPTISGYVAIATGSEWVLDTAGADTFLDLTDTPAIYSGAGGKPLVVTDEEDGVKFTTVTIDQWIGANSIRAPGVKPATFVLSGIRGTWQFANAGAGNEETISGTIRIPSNMDRTVVPTFKIGWSTTTIYTDDSTDNETAEWQLEYLWIAANDDTTAAAQETLTQTTVLTAATPAEGLVFTTFTGIDLPDSADMAMFFRIKRLSAGNDTIADTLELHGMNFIYTSDKLGTAT